MVRRGRKVQHGHCVSTPSSTYVVWQNMKKRCLDPSCAKFSDYGAKGITVAPEWMSFNGFLADMGLRPSGMTLERKDNSKGYCKSNCRWATAKEQAFNRRTTRQITHNGKTMCLTDWAAELGYSRSTFQRLMAAANYDLSSLQLTASGEHDACD